MSAPVSEAVVKALEPFGEGARMAAISGRPPSEFCDASDYQRAADILATLQEGSVAGPASPSAPTEPLEPLLADLERLALAATSGPWKACGTIYEHMNCELRGGARGEGQAIAQFWDGPNAFRDGQFVAAANPATVLTLIAAVRASEAGMEARQSRNETQPSRSDILERIRAYDFEAHYGEPEYERLADDLEALAQPNQPRDREEG